MMGRPPTPTALKILNGNPGKRPLNKDEPRLKVAKPRCPEHLDEVAQREWKRVVRILMQMRVLTEADQVMLGIFCQTYSTLIDAQEKLKETGTLYKTTGGFVQASPLFGIAWNALQDHGWLRPGESAVRHRDEMRTRIEQDFFRVRADTVLSSAASFCARSQVREQVVRSRLNECKGLLRPWHPVRTAGRRRRDCGVPMGAKGAVILCIH